MDKPDPAAEPSVAAPAVAGATRPLDSVNPSVDAIKWRILAEAVAAANRLDVDEPLLVVPSGIHSRHVRHA